MTDIHRGLAAYQLIEIAVQLAFRKSVQSRRRFVENYHGSVLVQRSRKRQLLLFAARQIDSVIVNNLQQLAVNALGQLRQLFTQTRVDKAFLRKLLVGIIGSLH